MQWLYAPVLDKNIWATSVETKPAIQAIGPNTLLPEGPPKKSSLRNNNKGLPVWSWRNFAGSLRVL